MFKHIDHKAVFANIADSMFDAGNECFELAESKEAQLAVIRDLIKLGKMDAFKEFLKTEYNKELTVDAVDKSGKAYMLSNNIPEGIDITNIHLADID